MNAAGCKSLMGHAVRDRLRSYGVWRFTCAPPMFIDADAASDHAAKAVATLRRLDFTWGLFTRKSKAFDGAIPTDRVGAGG